MPSSRRNFLRQGGLSVVSLLALPAWTKVWGSPYAGGYPLHNIPADKNLDPAWVKSLYARGSATTYLKSNNELKYIGMPAGGLHSGTLYMGGDGRLWLWGIYNDDREGVDPRDVLWNDGTKETVVPPRNGANYVDPTIAANKRVLEQGFAVKILYDGRTVIKQLREEDWDDVAFEATYPLGTVTYRDKQLPVEIILKGGAFYIPLNAEDSALPATFLSITIKNRSVHPVRVDIAGWLENGVKKITAKAGEGQRQNQAIANGANPTILYSFVADGAGGNGHTGASADRDAGTMSFALMNREGLVQTDANPFPITEAFFSGGSQVPGRPEAAGPGPSQPAASGPGLPQPEASGAPSQKDPAEKLIGSISTAEQLSAGASFTADYVLSWHFNHTLQKLQTRMPESKDGYHYAARFKDASETIRYIGENFRSLKEQTGLWQETFYDSSLPHWFLERTLLNIGTIATANTYRFASGRFWGWEGVNSCEGTCTHVWQYGQALARIFPSLERDTRQRVDLGVAQQPDGGIRFRAEFTDRPAIDGQAGTILRFYREHQMSADDRFLRDNWSRIKLAVTFMLAQDKNGDGLTDTPMENTLDAMWDGEIAWIAGLCIAAARAAQRMAGEMNDTAFEDVCRNYVEKGCANMTALLFNGEYFIHRPDAILGRKKLGSYNTCHIDQVYGQSWAFQVGLGRLWDERKTHSALRALWKYNFAPDVGPYIRTHTGGRPYALEGEAGLIMNTNPHNEDKPYGDDVTWQMGYFHECMSGFEHQVAAHLMAEGMTDEALILTRAIHDRYHAAKRNPYNEIECSDHYARAMASYGTFISACGFEYHGPKGYIRFAPRLSPDNFKAAFTAAEGWGSFSQKRAVGALSAQLQVHYGKLALQVIGLSLKVAVPASRITLDGKDLPHTLTQTGGDVLITLRERTTIEKGHALHIQIG